VVAQKHRDFAVKVPQFNIVAVNELPCAFFGRVIIGTHEVDALHNVSIQTNHVGPVLVHLGGASPGEFSHSLMREAVSACRARRKSNSRAIVPGRSFSAASLNRAASSASRCSKVGVRSTRLLPWRYSPTKDFFGS
jgi:hypothetical protein